MHCAVECSGEGVAVERAALGIYNATRGAAVPYLEVAHAASRAAGGDGRIAHITLANTTVV